MLLGKRTRAVEIILPRMFKLGVINGGDQSFRLSITYAPRQRVRVRTVHIVRRHSSRPFNITTWQNVPVNIGTLTYPSARPTGRAVNNRRRSITAPVRGIAHSFTPPIPIASRAGPDTRYNNFGLRYGRVPPNRYRRSHASEEPNRSKRRAARIDVESCAKSRHRVCEHDPYTGRGTIAAGNVRVFAHALHWARYIRD